MSNIDKQAVQAVADLKAGYTLGHADVAILNELASIALASLEAEPVAWIVHARTGDQLTADGGYVANAEGILGLHSTPLYTTPPAPISVPADEQCKPHPVMAVKGELGFLDHFDRIISERDEDIDIGQLGSRNYEALMIAALDAFRAAMLQGAKPVSNRDELPLGYLQGHKDGLEWAAQLAEANHPQTGDWLYDDPIELAKAIRKGPDMPEADGNSQVVQDGWVLVPAEPTAEMLQSGISAHYERSQIQIHDRPAPGPMECAYVAMLAEAPQQEAKNV